MLASRGPAWLVSARRHHGAKRRRDLFTMPINYKPPRERRGCNPINLRILWYIMITINRSGSNLVNGLCPLTQNSIFSFDPLGYPANLALVGQSSHLTSLPTYPSTHRRPPLMPASPPLTIRRCSFAFRSLGYGFERIFFNTVNS